MRERGAVDIKDVVKIIIEDKEKLQRKYFSDISQKEFIELTEVIYSDIKKLSDINQEQLKKQIKFLLELGMSEKLYKFKDSSNLYGKRNYDACADLVDFAEENLIRLNRTKTLTYLPYVCGEDDLPGNYIYIARKELTV
ncbi:hypothetical protein KHA80_09110 [Anaerobacillus sp. HL2]|nr:hypothetical protein KHA80_09110 [Anaerobacillus sp. HL2]